MSKRIEVGNGNKGATHCTVYSKLQTGLILQLSTFEERQEATLGGGIRSVKVAVKGGDKYIIPGTAVEFGKQPKCRMVAGFATCPDVPIDFWNAWVEQHKDADYIIRNLVFAYPQQSDGDACARDYASALTGLEPIDPNNLPRGVQTAPEMNQRR